MNTHAYVLGLLAAVGLIAALGVAYLMGNSSGSSAVMRGGSDMALATPLPTTVLTCGIDAVNRAAKGAVRLSNRLGSGSGFLISEDLIVTNEHVVEGSSAVTVQFPDGSSDNATVIATDLNIDLALIQLSRPKAGIALSWGDSTSLKGTQELVVVGHPLGARQQVFTKGSVSRVYTSADGIEVVQTDAAINPGNSGGPLLDQCGLVVGVVIAKRIDADGIGYAVAASQARRVIESLRSTGRSPAIATQAPLRFPSPSISPTPRSQTPTSPPRETPNTGGGTTPANAPSDLVATAASLLPDGRVVVVVGNRGPADASGQPIFIQVRDLTLRGEQIVGLSNLRAGATFTVQTQTFKIDRETSIQIVVDPSGSIPDGDRSNNTLTVTLSPAVPADLLPAGGTCTAIARWREPAQEYLYSANSPHLFPTTDAHLQELDVRYRAIANSQVPVLSSDPQSELLSHVRSWNEDIATFASLLRRRAASEAETVRLRMNQSIEKASSLLPSCGLRPLVLYTGRR